MSDGHRLKRLRRLSTDDDTEGSDAWVPNTSTTPAAAASSRPRRGVAAAKVKFEKDSADENVGMKLTVKTAPSKLKQVTARARNTRATGGRAARRKPIVEPSSSEEEEQDDEDDLDAEGEEDEEMPDADDDVEDDDAEGEEDEDMEDAPLPPPSRARVQAAKNATTPASRSKAAPAAPPPKPTDDSDDDELSSLDSMDEDEEQDEDDDEDAEGEDAEGEDAEGEEEEPAPAAEDDDVLDAEGSDEENDSDGSPISGSRDGTPDLSRLTRRQRAAYEDFDGDLMALSNEAQKKKHLTAEEHAMRRAEMARRRKNLSEKRNEEEKMDTINRLLKKQAPKRRKKAEAGDMDLDEEDSVENRPPVGFAHMVQGDNGTTISVPEEWLDAPVGQLFTNPVKASKPQAFTGRMVQVIE